MSSPFGSSLLVTGPEALLAQRVVSDVKARALAAQPGADVNEINAADLEFSMLSEVVGGSLFASHLVAVIDDVGACPAGVVGSARVEQVAPHRGERLLVRHYTG